MQLIPDWMAEGGQPPPTKKRRTSGDPARPLSQEDPVEPVLPEQDVRKAMQAILPDLLQSAVAVLLPTLLQTQPEISGLLSDMSRTSKVQQELLRIAQATQTGYDSLAVGGLMHA